MHKQISKIVIVGGGSAGWITAGILAAKHNCKLSPSVQVSVIESADIATVGVGEGTWPSMRATLKDMGIFETDFIKQCDVSFKQGSKFVNWQTGENDAYYHPFTPPVGLPEFNIAPYWLAVKDKVSFADAVCTQGILSEKYLAPKQISTPEYAFNLNYGYHLDASKFAEFLKQHCTENLGVEHIQGKVIKVNNDNEGYIHSLDLESQQAIYGDLFIDCTGFSSLLLGQHYQVPFESKKRILMNDSAVAIQVPYESDSSPIASCTISTAQKSGWTWDIGLPTRRGAGYVYSSTHCDDTEAQQTLFEYLQNTGVPANVLDKVTPRKISFTPGHRKEFWHKNAVAIGISAGFIEPLEASALVLIELSARLVSEQLPQNREHMAIVSSRFNDTFNYRWQRIVDFLKLHYVLSKRDDSEYWKAMSSADSTPDSLKELLELWKYQTPSKYDNQQAEELFPFASFQYVLYGMGYETQLSESDVKPHNVQESQRLFKENQQHLSRLNQALPSNRELLNKINQYGLSRI
ncbi:tryptophan halogenase family protein [uncultured Paraglaciecola sp.]|uniref:tryptophan halogenase family protein n=1 Tax=uncultured Paraglaciecola sp. TaxID=1765024 RepID=UPI002591EBF9|nr:tryptophan halogenase family protein [uncultured Paraglaciecola sp.]